MPDYPDAGPPMMSSAEAAMWAGLADADSLALGGLFDRYSRQVYNFAFRRMASGTLAEEVTQATFVCLWRRRGAVPRDTSTVRGWLFGIAENECRNAVRAAMRADRLRTRLRDLYSPAQDGDPADVVPGRIDAGRRMAELRSALGRLPVREQRTIELVIWSGLSEAEAATAMGVAQGTVKSRLSRARGRLTQLLDPAAGSPRSSPRRTSMTDLTDLTELLTPPPQHDLPAARSAEIRDAVLRSTLEPRPRPSRRRLWWVAVPLVAALALLAAVGVRVFDAPSVVGAPSPAPATTPAALPAGSVETDAGALDEQQARAVIAAVDRPSDLRPGALVEVLVARRLTTALGEGTFVVWTTADASTWFTVKIPGELETSGPITGPAAKKPPRLPDAEHPVTRLTDLSVFGWRTDADRPDANASDLHSAQVYLTVPTVERVEVRMTIEGTPGPWFSAPVHDGYAMVPAVAMGRHSTTENVDKVTTIEDRAWDPNGTKVPIRAR